MKVLFASSVIAVLTIATFVESGLSSCTKDHTIYDTVTVVHHDTVTVQHRDTLINTDTVTISDTIFTDSILTSHPWKFQELRAVYGGSMVYYLRGGSSNTLNYDNEYVVFNADHTGYEYDAAGYLHNIPSWTLTSTDKTTLTFTYYNTPSVTTVITWDRIRYKSGNMHFEDYYLDNYINLNYHGYEIRMPK
jgi:hypothetical protein